MRSDQFDIVGSELFIERFTVVGTIHDKSPRQSEGESLIDDSLNKGDFMWTSRIRVQGD
jgi:hypothetical protein